MQVLEFIRDFFKHIYSSGVQFGHIWLTHFGCASGLLRLYYTFFGWDFIWRHDTYWWSSFFRRCIGYIRHFVLMCYSSTFYLIQTILPSYSFLYFLAGFNRKVMKVCGDIMGLRSWEFIQGLLMGCHVRLPISFGGVGLLFMEVVPHLLF